MLQNKTMIVTLTIMAWTGRKLDKKVTDEVNTNHNAADDAGRYNKLLVAKHHTEAVTKAAGRARAYHYESTLAWGDNNERLLTTAKYWEYIQEMGRLKSNYEQAVKDFLANYEKVIEEGKTRLNGMYRDSDYPTRHQIEAKFGFRTTFLPVPSTDIRVGLNNEEVDRLKVKIEEEINSRVADAVRDIWGRVKDQLTHMKDRLSGADKKFKDSLFGNLRELIDLLPKLNFTGDPNIEQVCRDMERLMEDPETIRNNPSIRSQKAEEVDAIYNKFSSFFNA